MVPWNDPSLITAATCFAVCGATVAPGLLAVDYFRPRWSARAALIAAVGLLAGCVLAGFWLQTWLIAAVFAILASFTFFSLMVRTRVFQYAIARATRPPVAMAALLAICLMSTVYVQMVDRFVPIGEFDGLVSVGAHFHVIEGVVARTDLGQALPLIAYDNEPALNEAERRFLATPRYEHQIIRLAEPSTACNCHGWVYTGGRYAIQGCYVDGLLSDNGYRHVEQAQAGDIVIYRSASGSVEHTGLVRFVDNKGLILVESKWGPLGVYLHPVDTQPYGISHGYYRSSRTGHLVTVETAPASLESSQQVVASSPPRLASDHDALAATQRGSPATDARQ